MSKEKRTNKPKWGGKRLGSGRKEGSGEKTKICISVNESNWNTATKRWKGKGSRLIDALLARYVMNEVQL